MAIKVCFLLVLCCLDKVQRNFAEPFHFQVQEPVDSFVCRQDSLQAFLKVVKNYVEAASFAPFCPLSPFTTIVLDKNDILKLYESCNEQMEGSEFLLAAADNLEYVVTENGKEGLGKTLEDLKHISVVVYGLGSLSRREEVEVGLEERHDSLHQFVFITSLLEILRIPSKNVDFFDPKFTHLDKEIITDFGYNFVDRNEFGQRKVDNLTLFYLPFVSFFLINAVLSANWSPENLSNVIILGNSFQDILSTIEINFPHSPSLYCYIKKANRVANEVALNIPEDNSEYPSAEESAAFDEQSFHVFPPSLVKKTAQDAKFWAIDSTFQAHLNVRKVKSNGIL